ncbi:RNA polymerase sigma factor SigJ [Cohnella rhizosphaerae]|uniref:RNA polymerase sigma factor SigJ n=1 Tax=Cohnella rhizosphaerae TaxID=1457232 RepID=A0A9X4KWE6_9BACL|nr:RNA polymerase sigma factor SigJ [Cohnella rhizosphaerae]MDG0809257.1 RNA polymerase sigma factor SigJ [Cohnella rhizosphaerae]
MELDAAYRTYRPLLLSLAYRMLGSVSQAEDLVQDAFVTVQQQDTDGRGGPILNLKAYLCKIVTNRCLDHLKSARRKREVYVGPWLPEPLVEDYAAGQDSAGGRDPLQTIVLQDTISYAFLVLLDRLTPIERAVFVLREAFEYDYRDIADFTGKTEIGCRKIYSRLKRKIQEEPISEPVPSDKSEQLVLGFLHATASGDMKGLLAMLAEDIVLYSDGGGKVLSAIRPITSSQRVLAFIQGLVSKGGGLGEVRLVKINGQLGFWLTSPLEPYPTLVSLAFKGDRVQEVYLLRNPDKLRHLGLG